LSAELFTNGIEWFGRRLKLGAGAVGSVLAAVGTALPETSVSVVGIILGNEAEHAGIGAILGAPMLLATLAMLVTGTAVIYHTTKGRRTLEIKADHEVIGRDLRSFFLVYTVAIAASFSPFRWLKFVVGIFLIGAYVYYVRRTFSDTRQQIEMEELSPLHFHRSAPVPSTALVIIQLVVGLGTMVVGANLFLQSVVHLAEQLRTSSLVLGLIIAPLATELPEKMNSVIWVRSDKDTLALGNISGAMVFQSSITPAIGLFFTEWVLNGQAIASAVVAIAAAAVAWAEMSVRRRISAYSLIAGGILYFAYLAYLFL